MNNMSSQLLFTICVNYERRNTVVVGAPFDSEDGLQTGSVFVYKEVEQNKWDLVGQKVTPTNGLGGDAFGYSVDIDEKSLLVVGSRVRILDQKHILTHSNHFSDPFLTYPCHRMQLSMKLKVQELHMCTRFQVSMIS
jgi:hypothetical protein